MKRIAFLIICFFIYSNLLADTSIKAFLVKTTKNSSGETMCHYDNGTVINIGLDLMCALSIRR